MITDHQENKVYFLNFNFIDPFGPKVKNQKLHFRMKCLQYKFRSVIKISYEMMIISLCTSLFHGMFWSLGDFPIIYKAHFHIVGHICHPSLLQLKKM